MENKCSLEKTVYKASLTGMLYTIDLILKEFEKEVKRQGFAEISLQEIEDVQKKLFKWKNIDFNINYH